MLKWFKWCTPKPHLKGNSESAILKETVSNLGEFPADNQMSCDPTRYKLKVIYIGFLKLKACSVFASFIQLYHFLQQCFWLVHTSQSSMGDVGNPCKGRVQIRSHADFQRQEYSSETPFSLGAAGSQWNEMSLCHQCPWTQKVFTQSCSLVVLHMKSLGFCGRRPPVLVLQTDTGSFSWKLMGFCLVDQWGFLGVGFLVVFLGVLGFFWCVIIRHG